MADMIFIYIVCSDAAQAENVSNALVEERLAACVNILAPISSIYRWEGKVERAAELPIIIKTRKNLFEKVERRVKELHSYDNPCIVSLPILQGSEPFLGWIEENTIKS